MMNRSLCFFIAVMITGSGFATTRDLSASFITPLHTRDLHPPAILTSKIARLDPGSLIPRATDAASKAAAQTLQEANQAIQRVNSD